MAGQTHPGRHRTRPGDLLFVGLTTAIFIGLSLTAAYSVWAAYH